jgi:WD40 repeat protein
VTYADIYLGLVVDPVDRAEYGQKIAAVLGVNEDAEDDLKSTYGRIMSGTGQWLLQKSDFINWKSSMNDRTAAIFWLFGLPASGKTALSSMVAHHLKDQQANCQYHFFSTGHQTKRTAAYCLRSIASQLAQTSEAFREALFSFHAETGIKFTSQDQNFRTIWEKVFEGIIFKVVFPQPLFWILDGIDEADTQSLIINSLLNIRSTTAIKIFLSSRPMKVPTARDGGRSPVTMRFLSENDTARDIRAYVATSIRDILSTTEDVQKDIIDKILAKASGSFLWVRLSLESLRHSWYTQDDIRKALTELPAGMLGLYEQMLARLLSQSERTVSLAHMILSWVSCSWRPLRLEELQLALEPTFTGFLNLEDTVNQICAHFVNIDNSKVSLIHDTARQFLTTNQATRVAFVQPRQAHLQIAERCLAYLSQDTWPRTFRVISTANIDEKRGTRSNRLLLAEHGSPLLGYATCYWAYHVSKCPTASTEITSALRVFFSSYCLSWIEAIALSANLRYLTRSARYLKAYAKRKKHSRMHKSSSPVLDSLTELPEDDPKWLQSWATDLIRVVGKFGSILIAKPSSIYQDIVPFCPKASMFKLTYGEHKVGQLSVTGLPSDGWDDRLARVSVGDDYIASQVLATESYFVTLVSSTGIIIVWYTETCEKARQIEVGEYVAVVTLNSGGTLLATASLSRYTVWELSSGRCMSRLDKPTAKRTIAMAFANNDAHLVIGSDDCSITTYNLSTSEIVMQQNFEAPGEDYDGCPAVMAISPDATAAAMAWRGKVPLVWHFQATTFQPVRIRRLRSSITSLLGPEDLRWQVDGNSLFILCQDTNFIEWRLFDDQQFAHQHLKAREFAINAEGSLVLTSDHSGTISVWAFPRLSLIYQLGSVNDFVRDVAFSPDGQRLYDVRDSVCNVWEPDVLVRPDEHDMEDESSLDELSLVSSEPTMSQIDNTKAFVSAIASDGSSDYYCCGRDDGSVIIHEVASGTPIRKVYTHSPTTSVLRIKWSPSGRYMVSSDDSARVIAKRLEMKAKDQWRVYPVLDARVSEPVHQFVFSPDEQYLLISTSSTDQLYDTRSKQRVWFKDWESRQCRRWVQDPLDMTSLIWLEPQSLTSYQWSTMSFQVNVAIESQSASEQGHGPDAQGHDRVEKMVVWAEAILSSGQILYGTLPISQFQGAVSHLSHSGLHVEAIRMSREMDSRIASFASECTPELARRAKRLVGITKGRVAYLDHDNQLCTWDLENGVDGMQKHFFLPRDWLDTSSLETALINDEGTFFCPKGGYVAVVRNGLSL